VNRSLGIFAIAASFLVGVLASHGCVDDRAKTKAAVFVCNPSSRTADADCGKGFFCYSAAQALGNAICVPHCDPTNAASCAGGACTASGACLTRCKVPAAGETDHCPSPLLCRRTTDSTIEAAAAPDGVCLPVNATCADNADCRSPIFNECTSNVNGAHFGPGLLASGEVCVQGKCSERGIACEPGSACVRDLLPPTIPAPDLCSPICESVRQRTDGGVFNECAPGLTCLSDAFPQTDAPACAPGFTGWLCVDDLGCTTNKCYDWGVDVSPAFKGFRTCAPTCTSDDDCVPYDRSNPSFITRNICQKGVCRNLSSLFFPLICMRETDVCQLDPQESKCVLPNPDMGTGMGLGAFGGLAGGCVHGCTDRTDCTALAQQTHTPMTCGHIGNFAACQTIIPLATSCNDNGDCFGDLTCEAIGAGRKSCTRRCTSSTDCAQDIALGSVFFCAGNGLCVPKIDSGQMTMGSDFCISGKSQNGVCVSPTGWACSDSAQCANAQCNLLAGTNPTFGRCN
jgi:hypothetical protein